MGIGGIGLNCITIREDLIGEWAWKRYAHNHVFCLYSSFFEFTRCNNQVNFTILVAVLFIVGQENPGKFLESLAPFSTAYFLATLKKGASASCATTRPTENLGAHVLHVRLPPPFRGNERLTAW